MSDDANLTPQQEADLRRLLAESRHDDPMPDDVVARLDRVLTQLAAGDSDLDPATVVELASRRRRMAATLLVAAAAIVAIGVGVAQVIPIGDRSPSGADSASSAEAESPAAGLAESSTDQSVEGSRAVTAAPAPKSALAFVRSAHFPGDVRRVGVTVDMARLSFGLATTASGTSAQSEMDDNGTTGSGAKPDVPSAGQLDQVSRDAFDCAPAAWGSGKLAPVLYDGEAAVLAFRPPTGDTRVVDLLECGTGDILRSVTLAIR